MREAPLPPPTPPTIIKNISQKWESQTHLSICHVTSHSYQTPIYMLYFYMHVAEVCGVNSN